MLRLVGLGERSGSRAVTAGLPVVDVLPALAVPVPVVLWPLEPLEPPLSSATATITPASSSTSRIAPPVRELRAQAGAARCRRGRRLLREGRGACRGARGCAGGDLRQRAIHDRAERERERERPRAGGLGGRQIVPRAQAFAAARGCWPSRYWVVPGWLTQVAVLPEKLLQTKVKGATFKTVGPV